MSAPAILRVNRPQRRWTLLLILLVLLAGCSTPLPRPAEPAPDPAALAWTTRQARLAPRTRYALRGRLAIQRGNEGAQAQFDWRQDDTHWELRLLAPLGQGTVRLEGSPDGVTLTTVDGQRYRAADLDALMTTHLQWSLPVAGARYWILGLPVPDRPVAQLALDATGRLTDLAQDGWRISVLEYGEAPGLAPAEALPRRLFLLGKDVQLRLVVTAWTTPPH